jgi:hypothetical protein
MGEWLRDAAIGIMPFIVIWLVFRTDRLGRQIEACSHIIQLEIARHDEERQDELRAEWEEDRKEERKENRRVLITWGIIGAVGIVIWFLLSAR